MNARRRQIAKELMQDMTFTKKQAYLAAKGVKGYRKPLSKSSIWQKLKAIKRLGTPETLTAAEETLNENTTNS